MLISYIGCVSVIVVCVLCVWYHEVFNKQRFDACKNTLLLLGSEWDKSGVVEVSVLLRCGTASLND